MVARAMVLRGRGPDHGVALIADGSQPAKVADAVIDGDQVSRARRLRRAAVTDSTSPALRTSCGRRCNIHVQPEDKYRYGCCWHGLQGLHGFLWRLSAREFEIRGLLALCICISKRQRLKQTMHSMQTLSLSFGVDVERLGAFRPAVHVSAFSQD
jgi:hypothetical protein